MEELMRANKDLHDHILSILDTVVLPKLYTEEVAELPISLVEGLTKLVISRKCPHILNSLIPLFEHWLKSVYYYLYTNIYRYIYIYIYR